MQLTGIISACNSFSLGTKALTAIGVTGLAFSVACIAYKWKEQTGASNGGNPTQPTTNPPTPQAESSHTGTTVPVRSKQQLLESVTRGGVGSLSPTEITALVGCTTPEERARAIRAYEESHCPIAQLCERIKREGIRGLSDEEYENVINDSEEKAMAATKHYYQSNPVVATRDRKELTPKAQTNYEAMSKQEQFALLALGQLGIDAIGLGNATEQIRPPQRDKIELLEELAQKGTLPVVDFHNLYQQLATPEEICAACTRFRDTHDGQKAALPIDRFVRLSEKERQKIKNTLLG